MVKVSVIVPCYKYAHYLKECIASIRNQTYKNIEIIVVSDGSPDNTVEVCKELGVTCIEKENGGLSSARNAGIKVATGDYIMALDADDKIPPGSIEEHVKLMDNDMTIAQMALMEFGDSYNVHTPQGATIITLLSHNTIYCNAMFSRRVWEAVGGYDESKIMRYGLEDYEFWIRCFAYGCTLNKSNNLGLRYRMHANSMTKQTTHPYWKDIHKYIRNKHRDLYEKYGVMDEYLV